MKANAPKKVYLHLTTGSHVLNGKYYERKPAKIRFDDKTIEYTRTDVFIEKALKFIKTNVDRIVNNQHGVCMGCIDGDFRKYMEE